MENNTFKLNKGFFSIVDVIYKAFSVVEHVANKKQVRLEHPAVNNKQELSYFEAIYGD